MEGKMGKPKKSWARTRVGRLAILSCGARRFLSVAVKIPTRRIRIPGSNGGFVKIFSRIRLIGDSRTLSYVGRMVHFFGRRVARDKNVVGGKRKGSTLIVIFYRS